MLYYKKKFHCIHTNIKKAHGYYFLINVPFVWYTRRMKWILFHTLVSRLLAKKCRGSWEADTRVNEVSSGIIGSESDRRGDAVSGAHDILSADTALSERPHRHDIKTLK